MSIPCEGSDSCRVWTPQNAHCLTCIYSARCMTDTLGFSPVMLLSKPKRVKPDKNPFIPDALRAVFDALITRYVGRTRKEITHTTATEDEQIVMEVLAGVRPPADIAREACVKFYAPPAITHMKDNEFTVLPGKFRTAQKESVRTAKSTIA